AGYDGPRANMNFNTPRSIVVASDDTWYVTESNLVRKVPSSGSSFALAGAAASGSSNGTGAAAAFNNPRHLVLDEPLGRLYPAADINASIRVVTTDAGTVSSLWNANASSTNIGFKDGLFGVAKSDHPLGLALVPTGLVFSDLDGVRFVDLSAGSVSTSI